MQAQDFGFLGSGVSVGKQRREKLFHRSELVITYDQRYRHSLTIGGCRSRCEGRCAVLVSTGIAITRICVDALPMFLLIELVEIEECGRNDDGNTSAITVDRHLIFFSMATRKIQLLIIVTSIQRLRALLSFASGSPDCFC